MGILDFFRRKKQIDRVIVTDDSVTRFRPDGVQESVRWDDLVEVGILTTDEDPRSEDVFWLLLASDLKTGCAVPQGAEGTDKLLEALQTLPGFDNEAVLSRQWAQPPMQSLFAGGNIPNQSFERDVQKAVRLSSWPLEL